LSLLERLDLGVAGDDLVAGLGGELDDASAHGTDAENANGANTGAHTGVSGVH
jgi:hypothetical protein